MRTADEIRLGLDRLEGARQCRNLMGRFAHGYAAGQGELLADLWADRTDSRYEDGSLCLTGGDEIQKWLQNHKRPMPRRVELYTMDTEVLEVSEDSTAAHGCWFSPGNEADPELSPEERVRWVWSEYTVDFVRNELGQWKLWRMKVRRIFRARYCGGLCSKDAPEKGSENV